MQQFTLLHISLVSLTAGVSPARRGEHSVCRPPCAQVGSPLGAGRILGFHSLHLPITNLGLRRGRQFTRGVRGGAGLPLARRSHTIRPSRFLTLWRWRPKGGNGGWRMGGIDGALTRDPRSQKGPWPRQLGRAVSRRGRIAAGQSRPRPS